MWWWFREWLVVYSGCFCAVVACRRNKSIDHFLLPSRSSPLTHDNRCKNYYEIVISIRHVPLLILHTRSSVWQMTSNWESHVPNRHHYNEITVEITVVARYIIFIQQRSLVRVSHLSCIMHEITVVIACRGSLLPKLNPRRLIVRETNNGPRNSRTIGPLLRHSFVSQGLMKWEGCTADERSHRFLDSARTLVFERKRSFGIGSRLRITEHETQVFRSEGSYEEALNLLQMSWLNDEEVRAALSPKGPPFGDFDGFDPTNP